MKFAVSAKHALLGVMAFIVLIAAGCASKSSGYPVFEDPAEIKWIAQDIDGKGISDFAHIWMRMDKNGEIYGSGGCNSFRGNYSYENGIFKTGPLAMTRKACPKALSLQEFKFMQALERVDSLQNRNGMLHMSGAENSLLFHKAE